LRPSEDDLHPNTKFIDNSFIDQLSENEQLNEYLTKHKLSWVNYPEVIKNLYQEIVSSDFYEEYMAAPERSYEEDKEIWRKIYKRIILLSEDLDESLEEQSIYWVDDVEIIVSFVVKTIKKFDQSQGSEQELLPMFRDESDREFGTELLKASLTNADEYKEIIDQHTKNWELDRIAFMDIVIMQTALAELCNFPTIPVNVTLNEYIEISKNYSTEKSGTFVNGVLDNIVNQLKKENKLIKVVMFTDNKK
ncbi:transcription antitermination factor NusB, partial [Paludibacteraceae bacterium OttesenSCG-928-F17]|nr:transcription antitermination factor NusB [Paludibacteraceae bacterium OttesenSCG-928-F17]